MQLIVLTEHIFIYIKIKIRRQIWCHRKINTEKNCKFYAIFFISASRGESNKIIGTHLLVDTKLLGDILASHKDTKRGGARQL